MVWPRSVWSLGGSILFDMYLAGVQIFNESGFVRNVIVSYYIHLEFDLYYLLSHLCNRANQHFSAAVYGLGLFSE